MKKCKIKLGLVDIVNEMISVYMTRTMEILMKRRILIVEDDNSLAELIKIYLVSEEWETAFAPTGGDAITMMLEDKFNSGEYKCFSKLNPARKKKDSELLRREKIAYLFQNFALVDKMTVKENMLLATKYVKERKKAEIINSALSELGVLDKLSSYVYELSGGEQQRVAIARNMVKPYDVLLADEPTGSLDTKNKNIVINKLVELNEKGKTIIVVSHDADFKKIAKRNYLIENGVIKEL